jgi:hypothetical protein
MLPMNRRRRVALLAAACSFCTWPPHANATIGEVLGFPLRWIGGQLVGGGVDKLKGATREAVADVDNRLTAHEDRLEAKTAALLDNAKGKVDDTVLRIDHSLEARLLQIKTGADDTVDRALDRVDRLLHDNLAVADLVGRGLISNAGEEVQKSLTRLDDILRGRSADIERIGHDWIAHVDDVLQSRIEQLDEVAGRRLGNVDVIATKQRIAFEESALRLVALAGIVVFLVAALKRASKAYEDLEPRLQDARGTERSLLLARSMVSALQGPTLATLAGVALLYGVYRWLPLGAEQEALELTASHLRELDASAARLDYSGARFHASQLRFLDPSVAARAEALAEKVGLVRDLAARPTLLSTRESVQAFEARLDALEPLLGPRPDPDALVMRAMVRWELGPTRVDEHVAASLATRALRLGFAGFALAPLARAYVEAYLDAPSVVERGWSRDSATLEEMRMALARAVPNAPGSPFAPAAELAAEMRRLTHSSNQHYIAMITAHATVERESRNPTGSVALREALDSRSREAQRVLHTWIEFDAKLAKLPDRIALTAFHLNDAILTRAKAFLFDPDSRVLPPSIEKIRGRPETLTQRLAVAPARVAWARRYGSLFGGALRPIVEFEETERFRTWERWTIEFEQAMVERATMSPEKDQVAVSWRLALAASALSFYVDLREARVPLASVVSQGVPQEPPRQIVEQTPNTPLRLDDLLIQRGPRLI